MHARRSVSQRIMKIRLAAGGSADVCCTCGRGAGAPYRRHDASGHVIEGCVDAIHTGMLVTTTESNRWQNRPEADQIRRATLNSLEG